MFLLCFFSFFFILFHSFSSLVMIIIIIIIYNGKMCSCECVRFGFAFNDDN